MKPPGGFGHGIHMDNIRSIQCEGAKQNKTPNHMNMKNTLLIEAC